MSTGDRGDAQRDCWAGEFGVEYTERNVVDWRTRLAAFRTMLAGLPLTSVLEVGCNRGHNLVAVEHAAPGAAVAGIEPNAHARALASEAAPAARVLVGEAADIPFEAGEFDLVFTAGVLIHIPPAALDRVLAEVVRVARRYVLAIEYFGEEETVVPYRGHADMLWKRDFGLRYRQVAPELQLIRSGFWSQSDGFDDATWWLLEKPA